MKQLIDSILSTPLGPVSGVPRGSGGKYTWVTGREGWQNPPFSCTPIATLLRAALYIFSSGGERMAAPSGSSESQGSLVWCLLPSEVFWGLAEAENHHFWFLTKYQKWLSLQKASKDLLRVGHEASPTLRRPSWAQNSHFQFSAEDGPWRCAEDQHGAL